MGELDTPALDLRPAEQIVDRFLRSDGEAGGAPTSRAAPEVLIPLLQALQEAYGYLPAQVLEWTSKRTGIPTSRMYGVATFYAQFSLEPHGRHVVRCCRGTACHVRGGKKVISSVQGSLGLEEGQTSEDMAFSFETVACLGACALAPVTVVDTTYYGKMTPRRAEQIIDNLRKESS
jgi:NADH-quinone oxidoreductase subunit E